MALSLFAGALLAVSSAVALAPQDFTIVNHTGQAVMTLNVSPADSNEWGPDILGTDVLGDDEQSAITFDRDEEQCVWDIRVTYQSGGAGEWRGINLCETLEIELS